MIWIHAAILFFIHHNPHLYHNCSHMISHLEIRLINSRPIISSGLVFVILGAFQLYPHLTTKPKNSKHLWLFKISTYSAVAKVIKTGQSYQTMFDFQNGFKTFPCVAPSQLTALPKILPDTNLEEIGISQATQYITSFSKDPLGLGWWSVCTFLSCSGRKLHIIFAYRPCQNRCSWLRSIYAQQQRHFDSIHCYVCPQLAFLSDLAHTITKWTQQGEGVLLLADLNGDIQQQEITTFATFFGLSESILSQHPAIPPPATFKRGDCPGCSPIDGAWATPGFWYMEQWCARSSTALGITAPWLLMSIC